MPGPELPVPAATGRSRWWFPCSVPPGHGEGWVFLTFSSCSAFAVSAARDECFSISAILQLLSTRSLMHIAEHWEAFRRKQIWIKVQSTSLELMSLSFAMEEVKRRGAQLLCRIKWLHSPCGFLWLMYSSLCASLANKKHYCPF